MEMFIIPNFTATHK